MQKNVASQKIGAQLVSATDGSAFTGSVTVYVTGDAGTQAAGSVGSGACTHEGNGYHTYAPAQAETNYDLIAFTFVGTGAVPATVQVYTVPPNFPALAITAGGIAKADLDTIKTQAVTCAGGVTIPAATLASTTNITAGTIATVTTLTNLPSIPANWLTAAGIASGALDGKGNWNVGKTGYSLTATTGLGNQTANITGNLSGSVGSVTGAVGSITGVTFPTNFSALAITAGGIAKADLDTIKTQAVTCAGGVTVPTGTLASTTNITGGAITTVTTTANLTNERGKHANGAVWIGPVANTTVQPYSSGITSNPVSTIAAAKSTADSVGFLRFYSIPGGAVAIDQTIAGYDFDGSGWTLTTTGGSQDVGTSCFANASVIGGTFASTTGTINWKDCDFATGVTVGVSKMVGCRFAGTLTLSTAGNHDFVDCASAVAGTGAAVFAVPAGTVNISFRRWSGAVRITGITSGTTINIEVVSGGTVTLEGADGNVQVRGIVSGITDSRTGSPTLGQTAVLNLSTLATPTNITAGTITTATNLTNLPSIPANWLTAAGMASDASAEIADAVWDELLSGHVGAGSAGSALATASSGGVDPAVLADAVWDELFSGHTVAGSAGKVISDNLNATITSRMASYTQPTGFLAATFPTTVASTTNITAATGIVLSGVTHTGAVIPTVTTTTTATNLTNLPAITNNWLTAAGIAASALNGKGDWPVGKTGYSLTATTGLGNQTANITGNLSGSVGSVTGAVGSVTGNIGGNVTGSVGSVTGLTTSTIADQVWDEILSGHVIAGSSGLALATASSGGVDPSVLADAIWDEILSGHTTAGSAGLLVGGYLDAAISSRMATYTQPTGFLAATFPATVGSSTYAGADTSGTTTLLSRVTAAVALDGTAPSWYTDVTATGTVTGSPTTTSIPLTGLTGPITDNSYLVITSGTLKGQGRPITGVAGSTATVSPAFASAPASGVTVKIVGYHA
jgi:hypothetical protein